MKIFTLQTAAGLLLMLISLPDIAAGQSTSPDGMALIPAGTYRQLIRATNDPREISVPSFHLDIHPVTNAEFLEFVRANPRWRRSQVKPIFADGNYLRGWTSDLDFGPDASDARQPVTFISWFAAKAYAAWLGKRLPTTAEWEMAAAAGFESIDGAKEPEFVKALNDWYSTPSPNMLPRVQSNRANFYGVFDMHGLVWEWTSDFNSAMVTGDARGDSGLDRTFFCGAGSLGARDPSDFAAFMRFGLRSSLQAGYAVHNLGFRCAKDL